jgi:hypothetical protein
MALVQVRVYRPVMGLEPGTVTEVEEDDRVLKMIDVGHLLRIEPGQDPFPPEEAQP